VRLYEAKASEPKEQGRVPVTAEVHQARFAPDGRLAVFGPEGWSLWDVSGKEPRSLASVKDPASPGSWSRGGEMLFAVVGPGSVHATAWDVRDLPPVQRGQFQLTGNNGATANLLTLAVSPDGKTLLSGHLNGKVCFWDTGTGKEKQPLAPAATM